MEDLEKARDCIIAAIFEAEFPDENEVEALLCITRYMTENGWENPSRAGTEIDGYAVTCDGEMFSEYTIGGPIRLFDFGDGKELYFKTEDDLQYFLNTGEYYDD